MGLEMTAEQEKAFNEWWNSYSKTKIDDETKNLAKHAWLAAINYQENKSNREFRWDGVIR
jgi:hypothetical protein